MPSEEAYQVLSRLWAEVKAEEEATKDLPKCNVCWQPIKPDQPSIQLNPYSQRHEGICPGYMAVDQRGHSFASPVVSIRSVELYGDPERFPGLAEKLHTHPMNMALERYGLGECHWCGVQPKVYLNEDRTALVADSECAAPEGVMTEYDIAFKSGRIVVQDSLGDVYCLAPEIDHSLHSYNTAIGQSQYVLEMAKLGCAYGPVGNTCPGVYRVAPDEYVVASLAYDNDPSSDAEDVLPEGWVSVAAVITDLWAYSIADHDDYVAKGGDMQNAPPEVVEITPGTYHFKHFTGLRNFDRDAPELTIFAEFKLTKGDYSSRDTGDAS